MFSEFDMWLIRGGGFLGIAWATWVTKELISIGKQIAVLANRVLHQNP